MLLSPRVLFECAFPRKHTLRARAADVRRALRCRGRGAFILAASIRRKRSLGAWWQKSAAWEKAMLGRRDTPGEEAAGDR